MKTGKNIKPNLKQALYNFDTSNTFQNPNTIYDGELLAYNHDDESKIHIIGTHMLLPFIPLFYRE